MPQPDKKTVAGANLTHLTTLSANKKPNGAMPQPDEKAVNGCELGSFDNIYP